MINSTDIIEGAYRLLGRPQQSDLHYQDVLDTARNVIRGRYADMKMSARNHTTTVGEWVTPTDKEMSALPFTGGETNVIPVKMEWRYITDQSQLVLPRKAEIVSYENLTDLWRREVGAETFVAFYNNFSQIAFSEIQLTLSLRQYRLIYESLGDIDLELTGATELPDLFLPLCQYETAFLCLDQSYNTTSEWAEKRERLRVTLGAAMGQWDERFKKWQMSLFGNAIVKKRGRNNRR